MSYSCAVRRILWVSAREDSPTPRIEGKFEINLNHVAHVAKVKIRSTGFAKIEVLDHKLTWAVCTSCEGAATAENRSGGSMVKVGYDDLLITESNLSGGGFSGDIALVMRISPIGIRSVLADLRAYLSHSRSASTVLPVRLSCRFPEKREVKITQIAIVVQL